MPLQPREIQQKTPTRCSSTLYISKKNCKKSSDWRGETEKNNNILVGWVLPMVGGSFASFQERKRQEEAEE